MKTMTLEEARRKLDEAEADNSRLPVNVLLLCRELVGLYGSRRVLNGSAKRASDPARAKELRSELAKLGYAVGDS